MKAANKNITDKEAKVITAITKFALNQMGGSEAKHLYDDNYSWFEAADLDADNKHQLAGIISSLEEKDIIVKDGCWALTEIGIAVSVELGN